MGGLFGNMGGGNNCFGGLHIGNDCCSLIFLLLLLCNCGCNNDFTWLILLMMLCCNNGNDCGCRN